MRQHERETAVRLRHSIGTRIFVSFTVLALMAGVLGTYGFFSLSRLGDIVADTYDRPLMAINFARSASFIFAEMQNEALRLRLDPAADKVSAEEQLKNLSSDFFDDLSVAEQRSLSSRERDAARGIRELAQHWIALPSSANPRDAEELRNLSLEIAQRFDTMIELTADDSFLERRQSAIAVQRFEYLSIGATIAALSTAVGIAIYLTRRIANPLAAAAKIADRIGQGELQTPFPSASQDETGVLLNSLKVMQDRIRLMMSREQEQRQSAQWRLIDAIESSNEAMALIDPDGRIALSNSQFGRIYPSVKRLIDERVDQPAQVDSSIGGAALLADVDILRNGHELEIEDGRWLRISRNPTREGGFFLFISDITELKEREERYREAKIAAEAASITKSQFLSNMSHELRTPLNAIIGFSDMFVGEYLGPLGTPEYKEHAKEIQSSGWRLLGIIEHVLDLSNSQSGNLLLNIEAHDLRETVDEFRRPLQKACAAAGLSLTVEYEDAPLMMNADPEKLRRIIDHLTSNAIKFNKPGGSVGVLARAVADTVELVISDTGIGIPESAIPIAFSAFGQVDSTLDRHYEGIGLGLSLALAYAEAHGGKIVLKSEVGVGTTAIVSFTRLADDASSTPPSALPQYHLKSASAV